MRIYKNDKVKRQILDSYDVLLSEWGIDVLQRDVKGRYGTTHVIEFGDVNKKPLVLFHGVGDDSALMWIYNAKALSEHFHVFAVDT
ncbi:MAG: alpha/beta hydrolase, partial [Lachnospiraceae bacterium]|nr:alpha/beta hydrolase [Lachnospiraceae bacterium]